jgi:hypothetical protein
MKLVFSAYRAFPGLAARLGGWSSDIRKILGITFAFAFVKERGLGSKN